MEAENSIDDRMRLLIAATIPGRMRYVELEAATEISADTWKNFWFKRRKADALMVERLGRARPFASISIWTAFPRAAAEGRPMTGGIRPVRRALSESTRFSARIIR